MELPRPQYSQGFRKGSVKFFKKNGLTLVEAVKHLPLPQRTLNIVIGRGVLLVSLYKQHGEIDERTTFIDRKITTEKYKETAGECCGNPHTAH